MVKLKAQNYYGSEKPLLNGCHLQNKVERNKFISITCQSWYNRDPEKWQTIASFTTMDYASDYSFEISHFTFIFQWPSPPCLSLFPGGWRPLYKPPRCRYNDHFYALIISFYYLYHVEDFTVLNMCFKVVYNCPQTCPIRKREKL